MAASDKQFDRVKHIVQGVLALAFLVGLESLWGPFHLAPYAARVMFMSVFIGSLVLILWASWYYRTPKTRPTPTFTPPPPGRVTITPVYDDEPTIPLLPPGYDSFNDDTTEWL